MLAESRAGSVRAFPVLSCSLQTHDLLHGDDTKHTKGDHNVFSVAEKWPRPIQRNPLLMTMYTAAEHPPSVHWGGQEGKSRFLA